LLVAALTHVGTPPIMHVTSVAGHEQLPIVQADPGVFEQFAPTAPVGPCAGSPQLPVAPQKNESVVGSMQLPPHSTSPARQLV
jgi:hypothetical protein